MPVCPFERQGSRSKGYVTTPGWRGSGVVTKDICWSAIKKGLQIDVRGGPLLSRGVPGVGFGFKPRENRAEHLQPDCLQVPKILRVRQSFRGVNIASGAGFGGVFEGDPIENGPETDDGVLSPSTRLPPEPEKTKP